MAITAPMMMEGMNGLMIHIKVIIKASSPPKIKYFGMSTNTTCVLGLLAFVCMRDGFRLLGFFLGGGVISFSLLKILVSANFCF